MIEQEIYRYLCWYDSRHPLYLEDEFEEDQREPRKDCACDNCFYGRDRLAMEILRLIEKQKQE